MMNFIRTIAKPIEQSSVHWPICRKNLLNVWPLKHGGLPPGALGCGRSLSPGTNWPGINSSLETSKRAFVWETARSLREMYLDGNRAVVVGRGGGLWKSSCGGGVACVLTALAPGLSHASMNSNQWPVASAAARATMEPIALASGERCKHKHPSGNAPGSQLGWGALAFSPGTRR